jgi:beta-carotene/zeaxanthin 4-ketolase
LKQTIAIVDLISSRLKLPLDRYLGILSSLIVFSLWAVTLFGFLQIDLTQTAWWAIAALVLIRTFLHTGLFIIAHDAAHGTVVPFSRQWNDLLGNSAITLYGLLPYQKFCAKHHQHHDTPAQLGDPDFHAIDKPGAIAWYARFMTGYLDFPQVMRILVIFTVVFHGLRLGFHIPGIQLVLFWVLPLLLSSMQLFYFGTYLPHRLPPQGYQNSHHALSNDLNIFWSALTCYHFGYHWEHHEYPQLPWFKLPLARRS